ncbi:hypothetical protein [Flavobacterium piscinae]|uniref:hypothetical protein n=1 Tax=Flavobacterium piscinae TaxID=2506424 RepID=UPI002AAAA3E0|nr:hypothetical protein [Flavobacterium piscinae]
MIKPTGNIYYALNKQTFAIGYTITSTCNTYTYSTPFPIPDNGTTFTTATLNIPDDVTISDVNIGVNLNHTYLADLLIAVLGPGNNQVNLLKDNAEVMIILMLFLMTTVPLSLVLLQQPELTNLLNLFRFSMVYNLQETGFLELMTTLQMIPEL